MTQPALGQKPFRFRNAVCPNDDCADKPGTVRLWEVELSPGVYIPSNYTCRTCGYTLNSINDLGDVAPFGW